MADQRSREVCVSLLASIEKWKKDDLYKWLKEHGLKLSGRKQELLIRVACAIKDGCETVVEKEKRKEKEIELRKQEKLTTPTEDLPNPGTLKLWSQDYSKFPPITFTDIKNYLVYGACKFYKNEDINCFKEMKAFKFFKDGHVQEIELSLINEKSSYCFIKAKVLPSMKTDRVYRTWVSIVKETGQIYSADCNCIAG
jgi:hypothetical protein